MKLYTVYLNSLKGDEWVVAEIRLKRLHPIGIRATFAEACSLERTCRRNEFSEVLKPKRAKR